MKIKNCCKNCQRRGYFLLFSVLIAAFLITTRLWVLQIKDHNYWISFSEKQRKTTLKIASYRAPIVDRKGRIIAISVPSISLYAFPRNIAQEKKKAYAIEIAHQFGLNPKVIEEKLNKDLPFIWLARQLPQPLSKPYSLKLQNVGIVAEPKRYYPALEVAASAVGLVGTDSQGLSGIELFFNPLLAGERKQVKYLKDARGHFIQTSSTSFQHSPINREDLQLTIDLFIQGVVYQALKNTVLKNKARSAIGIVLNARTQEVLAIEQYPSFNPNKGRVSSLNKLKNLAVQAAYEPGSVAKPLVFAAALEEKAVSLNQLINCEKGRFKVGRHIIRDVHPERVLKASDVVVRSSNIGMSKIGFQLGKEKLYYWLKKFGFGEKTGIEFKGESKGILRNSSKWREIDIATHSFGQGFSATAIQIAAAYATLVNGGFKVTPTLIKTRAKHFNPSRIIHKSTSDIIRIVLQQVVSEEHGTGGKAKLNLKGIVVGGKTGTAQKVKEHGRGYAKGKFFSSFVGFVDEAEDLGLLDPVVILVSVDEPKAGAFYGGAVAAPAFKEIAEQIIPYLLATSKVEEINSKRSRLSL
ncbi:MAG: penicillin-binding protein 2 [Candidatus Dadabacteria bacterium]|nr:MAG: penicillin-binding protein 2 [Candidatus Dadabacteria bacterium]